MTLLRFPLLVLTFERLVAWGASVSLMRKSRHALGGHAGIMTHVYSLPYKWLPVTIAPSDADLEICVMDNCGVHALVFACRKKGTEWVDASSNKHVDIHPTHWRKWIEYY